MSGSPLKNLVELIPHDVILQELESGVKALPTVAKCPVNPEHKFMLHPDGASLWGSCEQCGFSGDSIDILRVKFDDPSVEGVIGKLERSGVLTDVPRDLVIDYQTHKIKRDTWTGFLEDAKRKLSSEGFDSRVLTACGAPPPFKRVNGTRGSGSSLAGPKDPV